jgi:hypothetical protein
VLLLLKSQRLAEDVTIADLDTPTDGIFACWAEVPMLHTFREMQQDLQRK